MAGKPGEKPVSDRTPGFVSSGTLQPCPFCASSNLWISSDLETKFVACNNCAAFGPTAPTITLATERWNIRKI
ncbi:Lar family restriction alleviation protein [Bradyrhizobium sp. ORS 111]|uniref:Lar family restriction alleviation protein n=1 Tax=Bradyrhizobium sp. ORS 111 TaxID=1685958 RepID=UPI00388D1484